MPSMTQTEGFDIMFSPHYWPPTEDCREAIVRVRHGRYTALVSTYHCGICRQDECEHTRALHQRIALEEDAEQMQDHADQQAETYAVMAGVG